MTSFNVAEFRKKFPLIEMLERKHQSIYFDNAATTQKFDAVIDAAKTYYATQNANVHRGSHMLSAQATVAYELARENVRQFIHGKDVAEIIWSKGTTEAINMVASSLGEQIVERGDDIVVSAAEHHANIVCWQQLALKKGANLVVLPVNKQGIIDIAQARCLITYKCKILAVHHISNVVGKINDIKTLIDIGHQHGAKVLIDGAQAIAHVNVDVQQLNCDFYVFSGHKLFAPTGIGVLYGKRELLESMPPYQFGGEMIKQVSFKQTTFNELPHKFEAGTPNIAGVLGLSSAITELGHSQNFTDYESQLAVYLHQQLTSLAKLTPLFTDAPDIPLLSFVIEGIHHQDVASFLDSKGIAVRAGHHCAMPLLAGMGLQGSVRVSLAPYNSKSEIDRLLAALKACIEADGNLQQADSSDVDWTKTDSRSQVVHDKPFDYVSEADVLAEFSDANSWDKKHRVIMLLSKRLHRLDKQRRSDEILISGCESNAWLDVVKYNDRFYFIGDSDARLIRGLMVVILSQFQGKTAVQIQKTKVPEFFQSLGLMQHLSPSRGNGVRAIVDSVYTLIG
ncbi:SufS family cysteine desulfurase [Thalassotalea sp. HSM 43]|uniref:SufS family cysteine desulfurase n=1 Tax=Thalassotalea sp. HSM 43 TaxID=2552945 RepID=UPI0010820EF4|nr:SufS family cysteine desulfurase [Thalassotalea sp. HSM 43]QBY02901.1 SufS family cysteine desulfurase [Thalassotalea sp. HSM 43]